MLTASTRGPARGLDLVLLTVTTLLILTSLAALFSYSVRLTPPDYTIFVRQLIFTVVGLGVIVVVTRVDYRIVGSLHWYLYAIGLLLLVAVQLFGQTVRGTTGWFVIGEFQFQPVELIKPIMAVVLAKWLSQRTAQWRSGRILLGSGALMAAPVGLVLLQPDFGSAVVLMAMWLGLMLWLPLPRRWTVGMGVAGLALAVFGWLFLLQPYQQERILTFIDPGRDPLGSGYNVRQAVTAVGSGQIFGRGLGLGPQSQLNFLPERHTDFIFASISEELGLLGSLAIVGLFGLLLWRTGIIVRASRDPFGALMGFSIGAWLFVQTAINILMNIGLFPVTGLPLPFLSYGGSSLLAGCIAIGLLENVALRTRPETPSD